MAVLEQAAKGGYFGAVLVYLSEADPKPQGKNNGST